MSPWSIIEHTADVGLKVEAESLSAALSDLVDGYAALVCPDGGIEPSQSRQIAIGSPAMDDLVVDLLDELNFINQTEGFLPATCRATIQPTSSGVQATLELEGEIYDPERHGHLMEIKATTYHDLVVERDPARIEVIFDI